jgi:hypothetical protein
MVALGVRALDLDGRGETVAIAESANAGPGL